MKKSVLFCKQTADTYFGGGDGAKSPTIFTTHLEFNWSQKKTLTTLFDQNDDASNKLQFFFPTIFFKNIMPFLLL